jgi:predicted enzyme related to lactoylglutathione lyase
MASSTRKSDPMTPTLNSILIYARDMQRTAQFYITFFGFQSDARVREGLIELKSPNGGADLFIHQAAKSSKLGVVGVKLVFAVEDVDAFKRQCAKRGLEFGATHQANGYAFANAKDPDKNSVAISSRAFRTRTSAG